MPERRFVAVTLDADMTAGEGLERLAALGFWEDASRPEVEARVSSLAKRLGVTGTEARRRLARDVNGAAANIRRQWMGQILWYTMPVRQVLLECAGRDPMMPLLLALNLHEFQSEPDVPVGGPVGSAVAAPDAPVGTSPPAAAPAPAAVPAPAPQPAPAPAPQPASALAPATTRSGGTPAGSTAGPAAAIKAAISRLANRVRAPRSDAAPPPVGGRIAPPDKTAEVWPRMDAPSVVTAGVQFQVTVGFALERQAEVLGAPVRLTASAGQTVFEVDIHLLASGVDSVDGWSRRLEVSVSDPTRGTATFTLVGAPPAATQEMRLTNLEVRFVVQGTVCGTASRPLAILAPGMTAPPVPPPFGAAWTDQPNGATAIRLTTDNLPADLTIEIAKPDGNVANGQFELRLYSPHVLPQHAGSLGMNLGQDARTFASELVKDIRAFSDDPLVDNALAAAAISISRALPPAVHAALQAVAKITAPDAPSVLLVSAEPYVPWELTLVDPPIDATRPPFLGAQTMLGRWIRDPHAGATSSTGRVGSTSGTGVAEFPSAAGPSFADRPPVDPPSTMRVQHMAVMAGMYMGSSGLRRLPEAENEVASLAASYDAVQLAATTVDFKALLDAKLVQRFVNVGGADAVHFAGHGEVDANVPDGAMLMLSNGRALPSLFFQSARYGGARQPLVFFNACMIGVGGELLGDFGGFPGSCLRGGFGGVLGALWEVDDVIAAQFALAFWKRALPSDGSAAEPVGQVLRDLRSNYDDGAPVHTWLSYVYYGHPRLTMTRVT